MSAEYSCNSDEVVNRFPEKLFDSLVGGTYDFYGVDGNTFCIGVNGARMALEAVEDRSDGYRSYFGCFTTSEMGKIFFTQPVARVQLMEGGLSERIYSCGCTNRYDKRQANCNECLRMAKDNFSGWVLRDVDTDHEWLTIGTDHGDDYYPCFTFRYTPDKSQAINLDEASE
jgi:hypothetical protein